MQTRAFFHFEPSCKRGRAWLVGLRALQKLKQQNEWLRFAHLTAALSPCPLLPPNATTFDRHRGHLRCPSFRAGKSEFQWNAILERYRRNLSAEKARE